MLLPTIPEGVVWAILLLPVASLLIITFVTKPYPKLSGYVTIAAIGDGVRLRALGARQRHRQRRHALAFGSHHVARDQHRQPDRCGSSAGRTSASTSACASTG